jgi:hypothetical protein
MRGSSLFSPEILLKDAPDPFDHLGRIEGGSRGFCTQCFAMGMSGITPHPHALGKELICCQDSPRLLQQRSVAIPNSEHAAVDIHVEDRPSQTLHAGPKALQLRGAPPTAGSDRKSVV